MKFMCERHEKPTMMKFVAAWRRRKRKTKN